MHILRSTREIAQMRKAGLLVWRAHQIAAALVRPGVTTREIDAAVETFFHEQGAIPLFKGVPGKVPFPAVTCISVNDEVVHGIPGRRVLREGDIVSIDTGCKFEGWCGDSAVTHPVAYVRFHGRNWRTWNIRNAKSSAERFDHMYTEEELAEWVEPLGRLAGEAEEAYALMNNNRDDFAPRSAQLLRGLLDEAGIAASGGVEPARDAQLDLGV